MSVRIRVKIRAKNKNKEVAISDKLISKPNMVLEDCGAELWRFKRENKVRKSVKPEPWR